MLEVVVCCWAAVERGSCCVSSCLGFGFCVLFLDCFFLLEIADGRACSFAFVTLIMGWVLGISMR